MNTNKYKLMSTILYIIKALLIFGIFKYIGGEKLSSCEAGMITIVIMFMIILCDLFYKSNVKEPKCECDEPFSPLDIPESIYDKYEHFTSNEEITSGEKIFNKINNTVPIITPAAEYPKAEQPKVEQPKVEQPKMEQPKAEQLKMEQPKAEQLKAEQPKAEQLKAKQPKTESSINDEIMDHPSVKISINKNKITQEQEQEQEQEQTKSTKIPLNKMLNKSQIKIATESESEGEVERESHYNKIQKPKFFSPYATVEDNYLINDVNNYDYNHLPVPEDYDTNLYEYGYSFLPPEKWYPQPPNPPVCVTTKRCSVCPSLSQGTPIDVKEWNASRKITGPLKIDTRHND